MPVVNSASASDTVGFGGSGRFGVSAANKIPGIEGGSCSPWAAGRGSIWGCTVGTGVV